MQPLIRRTVGRPLRCARKAFTLLLGFSLYASAQTITILHAFNGPNDGALPLAGVTFDRGGNLYGTTHNGGNMQLCGLQGCGTAFKLSHHSGGWLLESLYVSNGSSDAYPEAPIVIAPDGSLYSSAQGNYDCGIVFRLQPPLSVCKSASCPWTKTVAYAFNGSGDGCHPLGAQVFDSSGNLYGVTLDGVLYQLTPQQNQWTENALTTQLSPYSGPIMDSAGNLYGTNDVGGAYNGGTLYELVHSGSGWTLNTLVNFGNGNGTTPVGGLVMDAQGNIFGTTSRGGQNNGGTAFELSPNGGGWTLTTIYNFPQQRGEPDATLTLDAQGNLYGTTNNSGGTVFKLTRGSGGWNYTLIHTFTGSDNDGAYPVNAGVALDANGNLYGTTSGGGGSPNCYQGCGTVYEITP